MGSDDWESFDFETWGVDDTTDGAAGNRDSAIAETDDQERLPESEPSEGGWTSHGGILRWVEPGDDDTEQGSDPQSEAKSRWASESIEIPPGAPDYLRVRSLRAWLLRQRQLETEAIGQLLLERRLEATNETIDDIVSPVTEADDSPFELELASRQAAMEVYESLVESLGEMAAHSGPARVLVEFYLWLDERLALLATTAPSSLDVSSYGLQPPFDDAAEIASTSDIPMTRPPATHREVAEWKGRAQAALQARRRIEQVSQPEPED